MKSQMRDGQLLRNWKRWRKMPVSQLFYLHRDDVGTLKDKVDDKGNPRARQNVIFELGYFIGKLGRKRVRIIYKGEVESPSDIDGILYIRMDECGAWRQKTGSRNGKRGPSNCYKCNSIA